MEWNSFAFISFICFLLSASSAGLSFASKKPGAPFLYGMMGVVLAIWSLGLAFALSAHSADQALFWVRVANYAVVFLPALIFHFVAAFVGRYTSLHRVVYLYYSITIAYLLSILVAPSSFLTEPVYRLDQFWFPMGGTLFYFFPVLFTLLVSHAVHILCVARVSSEREQKLKIDYLLATIIVGLLGGGLTLSLEFGIDIPPYGILSVALMVVISTYAVLKHELLEFPETISIVAARLMTYICVFAIMVFMLEIAKLFLGLKVNNAQVLAIGLTSVLSAEIYSAIKGKIQMLSNQLLIKRRVDHEKAFRTLLNRLDNSNNLELMLPLLRSYMEEQPYIYHYAWYLDQNLLERSLKKQMYGADKDLEALVYQRVLFSTSDGRRHDRLPSILRLDALRERGDVRAKDHLIELMSSEQLDAAYSWIEKVPGREMLGLPVVANDKLRGMMLIVVSKSEMNRSDQASIQSLTSKLSDIVARVEFYRQQGELEQQFLLEKMGSLQSLAGGIGHEIKPSLSLLSHFVSQVEQYPHSDLFHDHSFNLSLNCKQARSAIARSSQIIDITLNLLQDSPIDASQFKLISMQSVVNRALAEYEFLIGERDLIETDFRQNFIFKGEESFVVYAIFNILRLILSHADSSKRNSLQISSELDSKSNILAFRASRFAFPEESVKIILDNNYYSGSTEGIHLGLSYCQRVMRAFGGSFHCVAEGEEYLEFRLVFAPVADTVRRFNQEEFDLEAS